MTRIQVSRSTRRNAWGSAAIGSALLAASTQFAAALENRDPSEAPAGGAGYVSSLQARFGPIRSAGVIDAQEKTVTAIVDYQTRAAELSQIPGATAIAEAQAKVLRSVTDTYVSAARTFLK